ncbi:MAG: cation:proton antiporter [Rhodospirillaceae bacterium]|jgi:monovalent cation:H+ antiporter-2, CPA2 family|nr:cation:proton antiporter [Rhodospirillaceae bacterium]MBT5457536.1 cation:proton antiporter [Rhodospirillaceae bacterium]
MEHATDLTGLAFVVITALACGMLMARFRQPPLVGYLVAGVLLGPTGFKVVESEGLIAGFAELGVLLLLFVVGMELSVRTLRYTWRIALPAVILQTAGSLLAIFAMAWLLDISYTTAILLGFVIALSSTAVAIKMLEDIGALRARVGRITVAVLIAQDLAFLPMLLVVENLDIAQFNIISVLQIVGSVMLLFVLVRVLLSGGRRHLPFYRLIVGHKDLSPLAGLVYCFGAGALLGAMGLSPAYGAFLAGLAIGNSAERQPMLEVVRPIQSIMMMVFFLSIGLLIDLTYMWNNISTVLVLFLIVTLFKSALNIGILRFLKESWTRAFLAGVLMSQVGEFSFLLAATGLAVAAISPEESKLIISVTVMSLALSPFWLATARRLQHVMERPYETWNQVAQATFVGERAFLRRLLRLTRSRNEPNRAEPSSDGISARTPLTDPLRSESPSIDNA